MALHLLLDRYELVSLRGQGGMGAVYEAIDRATSARIAVKVLSSRGEHPSRSMTTRFFREARAAMGLASPHVVRVLEAAIDPISGVPFMVMELLLGEDLAQLLTRVGTLAEEVALRVLAQACAGVQAAHEAGIIHRDIKPGNLFLARGEDPDEVIVKVLDFGIAKAKLDPSFAIGGETTNLTRTGNLLGSPLYMSPEQARATREIDRRADVWSLGVVLYRAISGRAPLQDSTSLGEFILALCKSAPRPLREIAPWVSSGTSAIARSALELEPDARYATADAMREAILALLPNGGSSLSTAMLPGFGEPLNGVASGLSGVTPTEWMTGAHDDGPQKRYGFPGPSTGPALDLAFPGPITGPAGSGSSPSLNAPSSSPFGHTSNSGVIVPHIGAAPLSPAPVSPSGLPAARVRRALAVTSIKNLTGRPDTAWLAEAFGEMLAAELGATERIRVIDPAVVARVLTGASEGAAVSEEPAVLGRALGADLLVTGSYLAIPRGAELQIRLAVKLHDVAADETLASFVETRPEPDLIALVSLAGAALRARLGVDLSSLVPAPGPVFPEERGALRFYTEGLAHLRQMELPAARDLLVRAVEVSPEHPLPRAALAEAWLALGHDRKAQELAGAAMERSGTLRREERMFVEGRLHEVCKDYGRAIESYRALYTFFPDDVEYGLRLAGAQTLAGQGRDARVTLAQLRKLPAPMRDDPRIALGEAAAASSLSDYAGELASAIKAAERAEAIGARVLQGRARIHETVALVRLGRHADATAACEAARDIFRAVGDRAGEARAWNCSGTIAYEEGRLDEADEMFSEALQICRELGHGSGFAQALNNIADTRLRKGCLAAARPLFEQALAIARSSGDPHMAGFVLVNLADLRCQQGDYHAAAEIAEEAETELGTAGYMYGLHSAYSTLGTVAWVAGDLDRAEEVHGKALALARGIRDPRMVSFSLCHLARAALPRGELLTARRLVEEALSLREAKGWHIDAAEALTLLAEIALREGQLAEAQSLASTARPVFERAGMIDHVAVVDTVSLLVATTERRATPAQIADLESKLPAIENPLHRLPARMAIARARVARGEIESARSHQTAAREEAERYGIKPFLREAKLISAEMPPRELPRD